MRALLYLVDSLPEPALALDAAGTVHFTNRALREAVARDSGDDGRVEEPVYALAAALRDEHGRLPDDGFAGVLNLPWPPAGERPFRVRVVDPPGRVDRLRIVRLEPLDTAAAAAAGAVDDQRERLFGSLAMGIVHDLLNPLSGINQALQLIDADLRPDLPGRRERLAAAGLSAPEIAALDAVLAKRPWPRLVEHMRDSTQRATDRVLTLLKLAGKRDHRPGAVDVGELVEDVWFLLQRDYDLKKQCEFNRFAYFAPPRGSLVVRGAYHQLAQAVAFLVRDLMLRTVHTLYGDGDESAVLLQLTARPAGGGEFGGRAGAVLDVTALDGTLMVTYERAALSPLERRVVRLAVEGLHGGVLETIPADGRTGVRLFLPA